MTHQIVSKPQINKTTVIAIDPGISGGIAVMRGPKISTLSLKKIPDADIVSFFQGVDRGAVAYLEKVGGFIPKGEDGEGQPGSRMFTFGDSYGFLRGVLAALDIRTVLVVPQMWQRGIPGRKGSYAERKRALREHATKLFPDVAISAETADALGILHYARFRETGYAGGYAAQPGRSLPSLREQSTLAEGWATSKGYAVPVRGTPEHASMVDWWANLYLNGEA